MFLFIFSVFLAQTFDNLLKLLKFVKILKTSVIRFTSTDREGLLNGLIQVFAAKAFEFYTFTSKMVPNMLFSPFCLSL